MGAHSAFLLRVLRLPIRHWLCCCYRTIRADLHGGQSAVDAYLDFLSGGCSKPPIELLQGAGVDMTTSEPIDEALVMFSSLVDEMSNLIHEMRDARA